MNHVQKYLQVPHHTLFWVRLAKIETRSGSQILRPYYWGDPENLEPVDYDTIEWDTWRGQPHGDEDEFCGCSGKDLGGLMHDCFCAYRFSFICEIADQERIFNLNDNHCA
ncbi:uncharacterized protein LOC142354762 [Convolutriloba macropyga]|uniref:uncharacterized protein LOC142354762 n=1 Tax=Convolutriloba macropyga TaxID=536237 RepID=UPI003F523B0D